MSPRRLIPYLVVFLVLVGTYLGLRWQQAQKETREQQAKQVFDFKTSDISAITLKRGADEIVLARQGDAWEIAKPLKAKADAATLDNLVQTLAQLKLERDLGPGELKAFGLEPPGLVASFTAKGAEHQLSLGSAAPAGKGYYVRKDKGPNILIIANPAKDAVDQRLAALRDKTLWAFKPDQVKSLKIRTDKTQVDLEKSGPTWKWVGRADFRVRSDRVEQLLQKLSEARINAFPAAPKDLKAAGLAPPARVEVTLTTAPGAQTLYLGSGTSQGAYARLGPQGEVVQVGADLPDQVTNAVSILEDRRLWSGAVMEVHRVVWGPPGKSWTAAREAQAWKITGPDKAEVKQSAPRVEMALINFQNLEYASLSPQAGSPGKDAFTLEFFDGAGKSLFRLEEVGKKTAAGAAGVEVRTQTGEVARAAVVPQTNFLQWQQEMARLTAPAPQSPK